MARLYYNTGIFGRAYSYLQLTKTAPNVAGLTIYGQGSIFRDISLNKDQILDLIVNLEAIIGIKSDDPPVMTGEL